MRICSKRAHPAGGDCYYGRWTAAKRGKVCPTVMFFCACVLPLLGKPAALALAPSRALAPLEPFAHFEPFRTAVALCPKCGRVGDSKSNCCSPGGAWEGMCGEGGQYTHHDGYQACNGNPAAAKSATDGAPLSVSTAGWSLGQVGQLLFPDATHFPHGQTDPHGF